MIIQNPIFKREILVTSRSFRLGGILLTFNSILAAVALFNMYTELAEVHSTAQIQYIVFLELYVLVAILEFLLLIVIMPALTAGGISEEREKRTLELMLTTAMSPLQIVVGKMMVSFSTLLLLIVSGLPILSLVFIFGGVTLEDVMLLLINYSVVTIFVGSIGILCSALFKKSTIATMVTYVIVVILVIGSYGIVYLVPDISNEFYGMYPFLLNPTAPFLSTILNVTGYRSGSDAISLLLGEFDIYALKGWWIVYSIVAQFVLSAICLRIAVYAISPDKK